MNQPPGPLTKLAEGREAELFAWGEGAVLRLLRDPNATVSNERQRAALEAARAGGASVPAVREAGVYHGRPGLVLERIDGPDLLTLLGRRPWRLLWAGRACGVVHARLHDITAPAGVPTLHARYGQPAGGLDRIPPPIARRVRALLATLPEGDRLCHGDFHPGNVIISPRRPVVIDWANVARGHPEADVARTLLLLQLGELPPGTLLPVRLLARLARMLLRRIYLNEYRRHRPLNRRRLARWETVQAAARLGEGIASERAALLRLLRRRIT